MISRIKELIDNDSGTTREAEVAAKWWTDLLRDNDVEHDNGEPMQSAFAQTIRDKDPRNDGFLGENLSRFEEVLAKKIQEKINSRKTWDYEKPQLGQTLIKCDYHADSLLQESAEEVGMEISSMTTFPMKTTMWIDPGEVYVSAGYQSDPVTIWEMGEHLHDIKEITNNWSYSPQDYDYELTPKVKPRIGGYDIRHYKDDNESNYRALNDKTFKISNRDIEEEGLESVLADVRREINEWREA